MGKKAEAGTPKAIANAMKAKGLQRLRWYCQVCEKQCRDENAFKQHSLSEGHVRQMLVVGEHASSYINNYSNEFQRNFLALLSRRWGTKRVRANQVYQEFIQDKSHTHMNSTRWVTLSAFIQYLGRSGICHVDETEKGWFIAWIDNSPKALARSDAAKKKERQDMNDEERQRRMLAEQMERAKAIEQGEDPEAGPSTQVGAEQRSEERELEQDIDISAMQPIKLSFGGFSLDKGKGKELEASTEVPPPVSIEGAALGESPDNAPGSATESADAVPPPQSSSIAAPTISAAKPKVNAFKLASKPNPLKANPLKAAKASSAEASSQAGSASSGGAKRPISAVEAIIMEDMEKKKRRENSTWSGARGHGKEGLQRRRD